MHDLRLRSVGAFPIDLVELLATTLVDFGVTWSLGGNEDLAMWRSLWEVMRICLSVSHSASLSGSRVTWSLGVNEVLSPSIRNWHLSVHSKSTHPDVRVVPKTGRNLFSVCLLWVSFCFSPSRDCAAV